MQGARCDTKYTITVMRPGNVVPFYSRWLALLPTATSGSDEHTSHSAVACPQTTRPKIPLIEHALEASATYVMAMLWYVPTIVYL